MSSPQVLNDNQNDSKPKLKKKISVTLEEDLIEWIDQEVKGKVEYRSRSHIIEIAVSNLRKKQ